MLQVDQQHDVLILNVDLPDSISPSVYRAAMDSDDLSFI